MVVISGYVVYLSTKYLLIPALIEIWHFITGIIAGIYNWVLIILSLGTVTGFLVGWYDLLVAGGFLGWFYTFLGFFVIGNVFLFLYYLAKIYGGEKVYDSNEINSMEILLFIMVLLLSGGMYFMIGDLHDLNFSDDGGYIQETFEEECVEQRAPFMGESCDMRDVKVNETVVYGDVVDEKKSWYMVMTLIITSIAVVLYLLTVRSTLMEA